MTPFPAFLTPFPKIPFVNEEATGCINEESIGAIKEAAKVAIKAGRTLPSCFFYFMFLCFSSTIN